LRFGLEAVSLTFCQKTCLHFVHALRLCEADFNGNGLINLAEEISRLHSVLGGA
jgi:hypothetical protein